MFLKEKAVNTIIIDIKTLKRNKVKLLNGIKSIIMLNPPRRLDKIIFFILTFLLRIKDTVKIRIKSKIKLINIIKSTYIFIYYHQYKYKKTALK